MCTCTCCFLPPLEVPQAISEIALEDVDVVVVFVGKAGEKFSKFVAGVRTRSFGGL